MAQSSSPCSKTAPGFLRSPKYSKEGQAQQSLAPKTVSIAVTKPSLFGKRPPPRTPSMTVKNRTNRGSLPESAAAKPSFSVDLKSQSNSSVQALLHPVFVTLAKDVQEYPIRLPDAKEALSAVCISRLGRTPASGVGSLPGTPFVPGSGCIGHLEFLHAPCATAAEPDPPMSLQSRQDASSRQSSPHSSASAGHQMLQCVASAPAPGPAIHPATLDSSRTVKASTEPQSSEPRHTEAGMGNVRRSTDSAQWHGTQGAAGSLGDACLHQSVLEPEASRNIGDAHSPSDPSTADVRLCILPSCSARYGATLCRSM